MLRFVVRQPWARKARYFGVGEDEFILARQPRARVARRRASVFDIIGKRRWFYAFSLAVTIPGLIFILLTPITGGKEGLQFSIDFTGGTVWEVHFANGTPTPARGAGRDGRPGPARAGAAITTSGDKYYVLIRTIQIGLARVAVADCRAPAVAVREPQPVARGQRHRRRPALASASASPLGQRVALGQRIAVGQRVAVCQRIAVTECQSRLPCPATSTPRAASSRRPASWASWRPL